jgi:DNA gyrase inhibitor GyrI
MADVEVKELDALTVMSLSFTGSYDQTQDRLDDLMAWMLRAGHPYSGRPMALFYDDPENTPTEELRGEVCLPIEEACEGYENVERKTIEGTTVATATFTLPPERVKEGYQEVFTWMDENGFKYVEDHPVREVYHLVYGEVENPEETVIEIQVPVAAE